MNYLHSYHKVTDTGKNQRAAAICADLKRFEATLPGAPFAPPEDESGLAVLRQAQTAQERKPAIGISELSVTP